MRSGLALVLAWVLLGLRSLAFATPSDQTWIGGWYDDADYDDVVLLVTATASVGDTRVVVPAVPRLVIVGDVVAPGVSVASVGQLSLFESRAPPSLSRVPTCAC